MLSTLNLRAALCAALALSCTAALATDPESGSLTTTSGPVTFSGGPYFVSDPTSGCEDPPGACDEFVLTVDLPAGYAEAHPQDSLLIELTWNPQETDLDLKLLNEDRSEADSSGNGPGTPERITVTPVKSGVTHYIVQVIPFAAGGATASGRITLVTEGTPVAQLQASGLPPRFINYVSPPGLGDSAGEPTMGWNPATQKAMYVASVETDRVTFPELLVPAQPQACDALWEDVTDPVVSAETVDPILETHQASGRTFVSHNFTGANALFGYTDDDGETWIQAGVSPPNGGADHQGIGTGPYPADSPLANGPFDYAVYFCSQANATAFCARSDTGGASFGNGMPIRTPEDCTDTSAIHGHPQVAPDGTVYVPNRICNHPDGSSAQTISVSEDAGLTWVVRDIPGSLPAQKDPAVGVATDGTIYACYEAPDHSAHAVVSKDKGVTWSNDYNISAAHNIKTVRFVTAVAGDPDRAGCAFIGTPTEGGSEALDFPGYWYPFVAATYDGGQSWHTVNLSPNDPIQGKGGVCVSGINCTGNNRNLLDFNDLIMDDKGQMMFAYADGCITDCVGNPDLNSFSDNGVITRQTGGRGLLAAFDRTDPQLPKNACMTDGVRTSQQASLRWREPDNGGAAISNYKVYRSTTAGTQGEFIGDAGTKAAYVDRTANPAVEKYYYSVIAENSKGASTLSNVLELTVGPEPVLESACAVPGITVGTDLAGDAQSMQDAYDILSMHVAEPANTPGQFAATLKLADLSLLPPNSLWAVRFHAPIQPANGIDWFVGMHTEGGTPTYVYGSVEVQDATASSVAVYTIEGEIDAASAYAADGTITLLANKALFGLEPGMAMTTITGTTRPFTSTQSPIAAGGQDTADGGGYVIAGNLPCSEARAVVVAPVAAVSASADTGRFGSGALGLLLLLPLGFAALRRRKQ